MKKQKILKKNNPGGGTDLIIKEIFRLDNKMESGFQKMSEDFRKLQGSVDNYALKADTYFQEMVMLAHKVDRLEKWIMQVAAKVKISLKDGF